jgi:hypothetical protein
MQLESQGTLGFDVVLLDRVQPMPKREATGNDESDENADQKEEAISRKRNQENCNDGNGDDKTGRAPQAEAERGARLWGVRL